MTFFPRESGHMRLRQLPSRHSAFAGIEQQQFAHVDASREYKLERCLFSGFVHLRKHAYCVLPLDPLPLTEEHAHAHTFKRIHVQTHTRIHGRLEFRPKACRQFIILN